MQDMELKNLSDVNGLLPLKVFEMVSGHGSFITIQLDSEAHKGQKIDIWVYLCNWKLINEDMLVASSNSAKTDIERALCLFRGRRLEWMKELRRGRIDLSFGGRNKLMLQSDEGMYAKSDDLLKIYLESGNVYCYSSAHGLYVGSGFVPT